MTQKISSSLRREIFQIGRQYRIRDFAKVFELLLISLTKTIEGDALVASKRKVNKDSNIRLKMTIHRYRYRKGSLRPKKALENRVLRKFRLKKRQAYV